MSTKSTKPHRKSLVDTQVTPIKMGRIPTFKQEMLIEYGKDLVKNSISQIIEFHKTMLGLTATFATFMATFLGLAVFGSSEIVVSEPVKDYLVITVLLMLLSSSLFAVGYYPRSAVLAGNSLTSIELIRARFLKSRLRLAIMGIMFFVSSILFFLFTIIHYS